MFYYLYIKFHNQFHILNLFRYITFRTAYASLTALLLSLAVGPWLVRILKEFQIGQYVREDGPKSHLSKAGTPTMGGVLINLCIFIPTLLWSDLGNVFVWLVLGVTAAFAGIGFWDDYQKVRQRKNLGLTGRTKFLLQILVSFVFGVVLIFFSARGFYSTTLTFPFFKRFRPDLLITSFLSRVWTYPLAFLPFLLFVVLILVGCSNAVNLTDGLDGLAIGCVVVAASALTVLTYVTGHAVLSEYLDLEHLPRVGELDNLLRIDGRVQSRIPLVQRLSGRDLHGRRWFAGARRRDRSGGGDHQTGAPVAVYWRHLRDRGTFRDCPGGVVPSQGQAGVQNGPYSSPF